MISIPKQFTLQGTAPFTYLFSSNNSQVTFSNASGTIGSAGISSIVLTNIITYPDESVLTSSTVTLTVASACGSSSVYTVDIVNPCDTFTISPISYSEDGNDLVFTVLTTNDDCNDVDYSWSFDASNYQQVSLFNSASTSILRLRKTTTNTAQSVVSITATSECTGCSETRQYTITPCIAVAQNLSINFARDLNDDLIPVIITIPDPTGCNNFTPDWTTLSFNLPSGITATNTGNQVTFTATGAFSQTSYTGQYNVTSTQGITSTTATINIGVQPTGGTGSTINVPDSVIYLDCSAAPGDTVNIPIDNLTTVPGTTINWNTFEVLSSPTPLGTVDPTIIFGVGLGPGSPPIPYIRYTLPVGFTQDSFAWTVADSDGNYMTSTVFTLSECVQPPTANDDNVVIACGAIEAFDVLANDVSSDSPISPNTVTVVTPPTEGSYTVNTTTGVITYQAPAGYAGTQTIGYTVANVAGGVSSEATITITIICAGVNQRVVVC